MATTKEIAQTFDFPVEHETFNIMEDGEVYCSRFTDGEDADWSAIPICESCWKELQEGGKE